MSASAPTRKPATGRITSTATRIAIAAQTMPTKKRSHGLDGSMAQLVVRPASCANTLAIAHASRRLEMRLIGMTSVSPRLW